MKDKEKISTTIKQLELALKSFWVMKSLDEYYDKAAEFTLNSKLSHPEIFAKAMRKCLERKKFDLIDEIIGELKAELRGKK